MSDLRTCAGPTVRQQHGPRDPQVVLDVDAAEEVADLIADRSDGVDEALLDDALDAIADAQPDLASDDRRRAAAGHVVAMELSPEASDAIETLIRRGDPIRPRLRRRLRERLRHKIHQARRRRDASTSLTR